MAGSKNSLLCKVQSTLWYVVVLPSTWKYLEVPKYFIQGIQEKEKEGQKEKRGKESKRRKQAWHALP